MYSYFEIALFDDTRHLRTRFRVDGMEAMPRGISGGKQVKKIANRINRRRVCLFCQNGTTILLLKMYSWNFGFRSFYAIFDCCEDIYGLYCIQKRNSYHFLSLIIYHHFLFSRINKLDRDFLNWQLLALVCPLRNHVTLLLSHQSVS